MMDSQYNARPDWPLAVVVGAGGLGMAVARRLGQSHRLLLADRDHDHAVRCAEMLVTEGHDAQAAACDVTQQADVSALAERARTMGSVRSLVHVVGLSVGAADAEAIFSVNLIGAARVNHAFLPVMERGGAAVFISSSAAHLRGLDDALLPLLDDPLQPQLVAQLAEALPDAFTAGDAYFLSKQGVNRMCQRDARRWGQAGVRILSLSPGLIATPMGLESYKHAPAKQALFDAIPMGREGTMIEIANVVAFLTSDQASYISGTDILVDGAMVASVRS